MTKRYLFACLLAVIMAGTVLYITGQMELNLAKSEILSGYTLLGLIIFLGAFNLRKKLSMLPLLKASTWLVFHVVVGLLCIFLFWLHTASIWPDGNYEIALTIIFYLVFLTGIGGLFIQKSNAIKLTETGIEVIYERIPAELSEIRERCEAIVLECTETTSSDTVANHYIATLAWYFKRPRFYWPTLLGHGNAKTWLRNNQASVRRYLNEEETGYFNQLIELAELKQLIDEHYTLQDINKKWLLVHLPLSVGLLIISFWHLLLVEVFAI